MSWTQTLPRQPPQHLGHSLTEPPDVALSTSLGPRAEEVRSWLLRLTTPRFVRLIIRPHPPLRLIHWGRSRSDWALPSTCSAPPGGTREQERQGADRYRSVQQQALVPTRDPDGRCCRRPALLRALGRPSLGLQPPGSSWRSPASGRAGRRSGPAAHRTRSPARYLVNGGDVFSLADLEHTTLATWSAATSACRGRSRRTASDGVAGGDAVLVPAGTAHAIGPDLLILEVQEPTDFSILREWRGFQIDSPRATVTGSGGDGRDTTGTAGGSGAPRP